MPVPATGHRALIGIPVGSAAADGAYYQSPKAYSVVIAQAGGIPLLLPPLGQATLLDGLIGVLDGLLLAGGGDVASEHYGEENGGWLQSVDRKRDEFELALARRALAAAMPLLGICRGIQVLNVAAGGTLIQDIPSEVPHALVHRSRGRDAATRLAHPVIVQAGSLLCDALKFGQTTQPGSETLVNSTHHQAIRKLAPGWQVSARAPDGIIEAIECPSSQTFVLGVQWHPERLAPSNPMMRHLFESFVAACQEHGRRGALSRR